VELGSTVGSVIGAKVGSTLGRDEGMSLKSESASNFKFFLSLVFTLAISTNSKELNKIMKMKQP